MFIGAIYFHCHSATIGKDSLYDLILAAQVVSYGMDQMSISWSHLIKLVLGCQPLSSTVAV